jgi:serine/threonine-protein kinase RsbW
MIKMTEVPVKGSLLYDYRSYYCHPMIRLANEIEVIISSALDNLDLVQTLTDCITDFMSFDEEAAHWIGMSVRESVTNAIQHGNKLDLSKTVDIRFEVMPDKLSISVKDQGNGFKADDIPNPLDVENLLKPSGRGIFYIRTFMDEVEFRSLSQGGTEVYMVKRISSN